MIRNLAYAAFFLFVFSLPMENVILLPGIGTIARLAGLIAFPLCLFYLIWHGRARFHWIVFWYALFVCWASFTVFWSSSDDPLISVLTIVQLLVFVWLTIQMVETPRHALMVLQAYVLGCLVAAGSTIRSYLSGEVAANTYERFAATGFNPNDIALILALGMPMALLFLVRGHRLWSAVGLAYLPLGFYAITLTASRTGFLAAVLACCYPLLLLDHRPARTRILLFLGVALAAVFVGIPFVPETSWDRLATTWQELSRGDLNARTEIWRGGLEVFDRSTFFGIGIGSFRDTLQQQIGIDQVAHNAFISVATELGLVGLLLFVITLASAVLWVRHLPLPERRMWYIVLLVLGLGFMTMNWEARKQTWLILSLVAAHGAVSMTRRPQPAAEPLLAPGPPRRPPQPVGAAPMIGRGDDRYVFKPAAGEGAVGQPRG